MTPLERIEALFHEAAGLPPGAERLAFLEAQCGRDPEILREVLSLLGAREEMASASQAPAAPPVSLPAQLFGVWRATELCGRGGMSVVYRAVRADGQFEQTVALKVMAGYLSGPEFSRRFGTERQLMARLEHENIAHLLDGGITTTGDPWLVTEYVDGEDIQRYCDHRKLAIDARLRLFLQVTEAVDYAHRNLIVHRDLKPANILVNSRGVVKLLDFGTASLMAGADATVTHARMLTPRYASPEQLRGEYLNSATDIFSLGVVLYELLTGAWPYGDPDSVLHEISRAIHDVPTKAPASAVTDEAATLRSSARGPLERALKGDLSAIVLKAIENDPARRYESVRHFAEDIQRYLDRLPVHARPQTAWYRGGRFLRRHWIGAGAAALFVASLSAATIAALHEASIADARYNDLRSLNTTLLFELKNAINDVPGSTEAQRILVTRVVRSLDLMTRQATRDPHLRLDLAEAWRQMAELQGSPYGQNLGDGGGAMASIGRARAIVAPEVAAHPGSADALRAAANVEEMAGEIEFGLGQPQQSIAYLQKASGFGDRLLAVSASVADLTLAAVTHQVLGDVYGQPGTASLNDDADAALHYQRTIELDEEVLLKQPGAFRNRRGIALLHVKLGDLKRFDDPEAALENYRESLTALEKLPQAEAANPVNKRFHQMFERKVGEMLTMLRQWKDAEPFLTRSLAAAEAAANADPQDARAKNDLSVILSSLVDLYYYKEDFPRGIAMAHRALQVAGEVAGLEPSAAAPRRGVAVYQCRLAIMLARTGEAQKAAALAREGLDSFVEQVEAAAPQPETLSYAADAFARVEPAGLRQPQRALQYAERYRAMQPPGDASALYRLAIAQHAAGMKKEAAATAKLALAALAPARNGHSYTVRLELEAMQ